MLSRLEMEKNVQMQGGEMKKWPNCRLKLPRSRNRFKFLAPNESASNEFSTVLALLGFDVKNEYLFQLTINHFDKCLVRWVR